MILVEVSAKAPAALPNEQAVADLPCIQHILDANRLTWSDVGLHPDCPFASFIHASQQQEPTWDLIIDTRRKCRSWLRRNPPHDFFPEACTKRCNEYSTFNPGLVANKRREGDEPTVRGLAGVCQCRINIIVVSSNHHHTKKSPSPAGTILYCHFRRYHPPCSRRLCPQSISIGCFAVVYY